MVALFLGASETEDGAGMYTSPKDSLAIMRSDSAQIKSHLKMWSFWLSKCVTKFGGFPLNPLCLKMIKSLIMNY